MSKDFGAVSANDALASYRMCVSYSFSSRKLQRLGKRETGNGKQAEVSELDRINPAIPGEQSELIISKKL